jgi:hypothetical protein
MHVGHVIHDVRRYLPCLSRAVPQNSIYEVKTVLSKNEQDDGHLGLCQQKPEGSRAISILGGEIDKIYDLFELIKRANTEFAGADARLMLRKIV